MNLESRVVNLEIMESALQELSDIEYQQRVWVVGSSTETSSMNEAIAALFNDSGLDVALEKNDVIFTDEVDALLRELRRELRSSLARQEQSGTMAVIMSPAWESVINRAAGLLGLLKKCR